MSKRSYLLVLILLILLIGGFLRFYKLDWGEGLYTHPDEYHIVSSVSQLSFPTQMHPHFFSYGTATIYAIYFTKAFLSFLQQITNYELPITNIFLLGRFYSALFSTLTILLVFGITRLLLGSRWGILAALLTAFTPGLIQQAHFATPESALTFFLFGALFYVLRYEKYGSARDIFLSALLIGIALGVKITAALLLPVIALAVLIREWRSPIKVVSVRSASFFIAVATFMIVAPYVFLDFPAWRSNTIYEGSLAMGTLPVFYTRQFIDTMPVVFQFEKILPYALGPGILVFGILGLLGIIATLVKSLKPPFLLLLLAFLLLFLPNAFLFAKWTRFIAPTFPFFAIFAVLFLAMLAKKLKTLSYILGILTLVATALWGIAFFSIYLRHDVRVEASRWLESNVVPASSFLVEGGNMVDLPLKGDYKKISLDFYNLESDSQVRAKITDALVTSDYFLIQSRRVFMNHKRLPHLFPKTARFYDALFAGELGFVQVKKFHSYPTLAIGSWLAPRSLGEVGRLEVPDEGAEETWSVFDHPVIRVFKKIRLLTKEEYAKIFAN